MAPPVRPLGHRQGIAMDIIAMIACAALIAACTSEVSPAPTGFAAPTNSSMPIPSPTLTPLPSVGPTQRPPAYARNPAAFVEGATYTQTIDPADFVANVAHPFLTLKPGAKWVYDGDEHVEIEVLPETKLILGVAATVVRDQVFVDDELAEDTLDWYAQDRDGNVWYFGEKTAEYENGKVTSTAGSWEGGVDGAVPGIVLLAAPEVGDEYRQEFLTGEAEDLARITALSGSITVPAGTWSGPDVLVTEEWTPLEPDVREQKTYARGFGVVESRTIKGGTEVTTLTSYTAP